MRERVAALVGRDLAGDVGDDVPLRLRADPARRGAAARLQARASRSTTRRTRCGWSSAAWRSSSSTRSATRRARSRRAISAAKNQLVDASDYARRGEHRLRAGDRRRLPPLRAAHGRGERDGLRRPAGPHGQPARAVRRRPRQVPPDLPLGARRRVPGHEPRPVPAAAAADRGAPQPDRGRRRLPVGLLVPRRRHPQHPRLRARLPRRRRRCCSSRTTARRRRSSTPPTG